MRKYRITHLEGWFSALLKPIFTAFQIFFRVSDQGSYTFAPLQTQTFRKIDNLFFKFLRSLVTFAEFDSPQIWSFFELKKVTLLNFFPFSI